VAVVEARSIALMHVSRCYYPFPDDDNGPPICPVAGQEIAWNGYHSQVCQHLPSIHYTFQAKSVPAADCHAGLLLLRLVSEHFKKDSIGQRHLSQCVNLSIEKLRAANVDGIDSRIQVFFELLPRPLSASERLVLDQVATKIDIPRAALEFLFTRFSGNNHVISNERLQPIGHAILYVFRYSHRSSWHSPLTSTLP
jgi:hypothetical protein